MKTFYPEAYRTRICIHFAVNVNLELSHDTTELKLTGQTISFNIRYHSAGFTLTHSTTK